MRVALKGGDRDSDAVGVGRASETELPGEFAGIKEVGRIALIEHFVGFRDQRIEPSCNPIKNQLLNQPLAVSVPMVVVVPSDRQVGLQFGTPSVELGGTFASITSGILRILGVDINAKAKEALEKAVDPALLQRGIPVEYLKLNPKIASATFMDDGGKATIRLDLSANVPAADLSELISLLVRKKTD